VSSYILDASALLAYLQNEPGAAVVAPKLEQSLIGAVNFAEVATKLTEAGAVLRLVTKQSHMALAGHPRRMKSGARRAMLRVDDRDVKVELRLVPRARQAV
jgi:PIN domain nuclease of toxin-antitoxin system